MKVEEFRDIAQAEIWHPFTIKTRGGISIPIEHQASIWFPLGFDQTICVAIRGKGIMLLDVDAIEAAWLEHQSPAPVGP